ncbi:MAG: hypothetical protein ABL983_05515 [Nitrospira sp.]
MSDNSDKTKDELTADEVNRYWDAYFAVVDTLIIAQGRLKGLEDKAADLGDRSGYRADRLRAEADIELMRAKRMAFNANRSPISPPNQATVDQLVKISKEVAGKTVGRQQAAAIVQIAANAVNEFNKIQKR